MPATQLDRLLFLQAGRCFFCDKDLKKSDASVEHLVPLARDGPDKEHNTVACCKALNGIFGSLELKAKLASILKHRGKFVCPADSRTQNDEASATKPIRSSADNKRTAADLQKLTLEYVHTNATNRPRTKKALARVLSTQVLKGVPPKNVEQVVGRLQAEGHLTVAEQGRITYQLNSNAG